MSEKKAGGGRVVAVIGAGAAGMMAAVSAASENPDCHVLVLEKNEKAGKKIYITGKGRCNFTNMCETEDFFSNVPCNPRFLYSSVCGFDAHQTYEWFERHGMAAKTERGNRAFPLSDHASDVTRTLERELKRLGVEVRLNTEVSAILTEENGTEQAEIPDAGGKDAVSGQGGRKREEPQDAGAGQGGRKRKGPQDAGAGQGGRKREEPQDAASGQGHSGGWRSRVRGVRLKDGSVLRADAVIIATGGLSYPSTGSTGDGYRWAEETGHRVSAASPSLVPLQTAEADIPLMQGLSLKNVALSVRDGKKKIWDGFGEMMFTHFGITGPLVLTASACIQKQISRHSLAAEIDLKPALDEEKLSARILRAFDGAPNREIRNVLGEVYPSKMVPVMLRRAGIPPEKVIHDVTRQDRARLAENTKHFRMTVTGLRGWNEAVITHGGVSVKQVDPSSMQSKITQGLYFAGEVLDVDALTGGFNLQIAWSTGRAAGIAAAQDQG